MDWLQLPIIEGKNFTITFLDVLRSCFWILFVVFFAYITSRFIKKYGKRMELSTYYLLQKISRYLFVALGFILVFHSLGFDLTLFTVFFGAIFVWIGFSLQPLFHNFIAGLVLLFSRNVKVGDIVQLESKEKGTIKEVFLLVTLIEIGAKEKLVVPNSELVSKKILIFPK